MFRLILGCALALLACCPNAAFAQKRVALVIGNGAYQDAPLANPVRDADAMAELFKKAGFDVVLARKNVGHREFLRTLRDFKKEAEGSDTAVVFYAGHAVQVGDRNYLVPVDAKLEQEAFVDEEAISFDHILEATAAAKSLRLLLLDASRNNPFTGNIQDGPGTARVDGSHGLGKVEDESILSDALIAYATTPGSIADDGEGDHSPFTAALLKHLAEPGLDIRLALARVRDDVHKSTDGRQEPFVYGSLSENSITLVPKPDWPAPR
jgi:uncharacterized caspase-like protein